MFGTKVFRVRCFFVLGGGGQLCYRLCYRRLSPQDHDAPSTALLPLHALEPNDRLARLLHHRL